MIREVALGHHVARIALLGLLAGCMTEEPPEAADDDDATVADDDDVTDEPIEPLFSFVIIADPHIAGPVEHEERLSVAVDWINANAVDRDLQFALVLGDIGWGSGLETSRDLLEPLTMPWVPIIGDNVLASGEDEAFDQTFGPQLEALGDQLEAWERAPLPVPDERLQGDAWLQNLRFEHEGVLFVGLDWNIRHLTGNLAEFGDFNDVPGGSYEWMLDAFEGVQDRPDESVVLLSHVPMVPGVFYVADRETFAELLSPIADKVYGNLAGHLHIDHDEEYPEAGYSTHITDATWDDRNTIRIVDVFGNATLRSYEHELIVLDE